MKYLTLLLALVLPLTGQTLTNTNLDGVTNATLNGKLDDDASATRAALGLGTAATAATGLFVPSNQDRLQNWRASLDVLNGSTSTGRPNIVVFGDSMVGTSRTQLEGKLGLEFGTSGVGFASMVESGSATIVENDCTKWITGRRGVLSGSGHTLEFNVGDTFFEANTFKLYYLTSPGAGIFKIQSQRRYRGTTDAWADESGYTAVSAAGTLAGTVITITKTDYRASWKFRVVWVSGIIDIIGGGFRDTNRAGAVVTYLSNSSSTGGVTGNNIDAAAATSTAITNPIFADLAPHLIIISHYDRDIANYITHQATVQDNMLTGTATGGGNRVPSFLIIGPPTGYDSTSDAGCASQQLAQQTLADSRGDAFFDNRTWALPVASAISNGYMRAAEFLDVHYTAAAINNWVPSMFQKVGLVNSSATAKNKSPNVSMMRGGVIRASKPDYTTNGATTMESVGAMTLVNPAGETGSAFLKFESTLGSTSNNDSAILDYNGTLRMRLIASGADANDLLQFGYGPSGWVIYANRSVAATPQGAIGYEAKPFREAYIGSLKLGYVAKTTDFTLTDANHTVHITGGTPTITLPSAADRDGCVYVIRNDSGSDRTPATTSSQTINGTTPAAISTGTSVRYQSTGANWITL